jgi:hypothetical protein
MFTLLYSLRKTQREDHKTRANPSEPERLVTRMAPPVATCASSSRSNTQSATITSPFGWVVRPESEFSLPQPKPPSQGGWKRKSKEMRRGTSEPPIAICCKRPWSLNSGQNAMTWTFSQILFDKWIGKMPRAANPQVSCGHFILSEASIVREWRDSPSPTLLSLRGSCRTSH